MVGTVPPVVADARSGTRKATSSAAFEIHLEHEEAHAHRVVRPSSGGWIWWWVMVGSQPVGIWW